MAFLTDYRSGAIGRISLETPASRLLMTQAELPVVSEPQTEVIEEEKLDE